MSAADPNRIFPEEHRVWTDPTCVLAVFLPSHLCRDRDGDRLDSRGRACFLGARTVILHAGVVAEAERIVAAHVSDGIGRLLADLAAEACGCEPDSGYRCLSCRAAQQIRGTA